MLARSSTQICALATLLLLASTLSLPADEPGDAPPLGKARLPWSASALRAFDALAIPVGLTKEIFAAEPLVTDPVAFCFDGKGRVYVAETFRQERGVEDNRSSSYWLLDDLSLQTIDDRLAMYEKWQDRRVGGMEYYREFEDRIRRVADTDGDGVADTVTIFSDNYRAPLDGTGSGVLFDRGDLFYTNIPSLYLLRDTDDDGRADSKEVMSTGYGIRTALRGHDMHGLVIGPDRRLYWSIGDRGFHVEPAYGEVLDSPNAGAVLRCELDGSNLEVVHHGLRNPQELAFDDDGNLFSVDNNSDGGDRARLVHIIEGGESGWQMEYQTLEGSNRRGPWIQEGIWWTEHDAQPAWVVPPIAHITSGPSGLTHYPGQGLPPRYQNHFFVCDFTGGAASSSVRSFAVTEVGGGFAMVDEHKFIDHVLCTDVEFGYDGRVYVADWGAGWVQNGEGRLYAISDPNWIDTEAALRVAELFRGGFERPAIELAMLLRHRDRRVRFEAQWELATRGASGEGLFCAYAREHGDPLPRLHGLWGLGQLGRSGKLTQKGRDTVQSLISDDDPRVRAVACQVAGEIRDPATIPDLTARLGDQSGRVIARAIEALGKVGGTHATGPLLECARAIGDQPGAMDPTLRQLIAIALARVASPQLLVNAADDPHPSARMVCLLALRRLGDARIARYLDDADPRIVTECARAIYDVPIVAARPALAGLARKLGTGQSLSDARSETAVTFTREIYPLSPTIVPTSADPRDDALFRGEPADRTPLTRADTGSEIGDRYACRLTGTVLVPADGDYRFALASDDQSVLFFSVRGVEAKRREIAKIDGWVGRDVFEGKPGQVSAVIPLRAGMEIHLDARQIEGTGGDHLQIAWQLPDGTWEKPIGGGREPEGNLPLLRRVIAAALEVGGAENASALCALAADPGVPSLARREALATLAQWSEPEPRERVQGEVREVLEGERGVETLVPAIGETLAAIATHSRGDIGAAARRLAVALRVPLPVALNRSILSSSVESVESRIVALEQLVGMDSERAEAILAARQSEAPLLRVRARELMADVEARFAEIDAVLAEGPIAERQGTIASLAAMKSRAADHRLVPLFDQFLAGTLPPELGLEITRAGEVRGEALADRLGRYRESLPEGDELAPYRVALVGGSAERGGRVFREHIVAQCSRCHIAAGDGGVAGPSLEGIGGRQTRAQILESIILPNAQIVEGYGNTATPSAMPQVHFALEPCEIRDLLEFLAGLK